MKTVVITGSARGLGHEMAKCFRIKDFNVIISDLFKKDLDNARDELLKVKGNGSVDYFVFGHYHHRAHMHLAQGGEMFLMGEWINTCDYLVFDGLTCQSLNID